MITETKDMLVKPFELSDSEIRSNKKSLRWLGWFAILLGILVLFIGQCIYKEDSFTSISASANFYGTSYLLPFVLGSMAIFFWGYFGYAKIDRLCSKTMSVAAFFVAMFQCNEFGQRDIPQKIGLCGLPPDLSNLIHTIAAVFLFGTMVYWIFFLFTKTKKSDTWKDMRIEKKIRNIIYWVAGVFVFVGVICTALILLKLVKLPYVWLWEVIILIPSGFALLVKSGSFLSDKNK